MIKLCVADKHRLVIPGLVRLIQPDQHVGLQPRQLKFIGQRPLHRASAFLPGNGIAVHVQRALTGQRWAVLSLHVHEPSVVVLRPKFGLMLPDQRRTGS